MQNEAGGVVARARCGDRRAFGELYRAHRQRVHALCLRLTRNATLAEDLTQEVFLQALRKIGGFRGGSAFSTWLYRVTVNTVYMDHRKRRRQPIDCAVSELPIRATLVPLHWAEATDVRRAISSLPPGYRRMVVLHEIGGFEHREIAKLLHCSLGNSKSQLAKGKARLAVLLSREGLQRACSRRANTSGAQATTQTETKALALH